MKKNNFKVGDRVRIRQWEDMEKEFGLNVFGSIDCKCSFTRCMKHLCGRSATIKSVEDKGIRLDFDNKKGFISWNYSTDMIEPLNQTIVIYRKDQEVIALDRTTGKKAVAKCSPDDVFDFNIGSKLAFERLLGIEEPKVKEVHRKAKVGEYVKVVDAKNVPDNEYKNGDVLRIIHVGAQARYADGIAKDGRGRVLNHYEYVVLEGYEPPKEEKKEGCFKILCIKEEKLYLTKGKVYEFVNGYTKLDCQKSCYYKNFEEFIEGNKSWGNSVIELKEGDVPQEIMKKYTFFEGKAVCYMQMQGYTKGKIYEFKDGFCVDDNGNKFPSDKRGIKSLPFGFLQIVE